MNISDSQRVASKLNELGYKSAPEKDADLVIVNSCSVRQKGIDRIWGGIKKWQAQNKKIVITGCVLESDRKKYAARNIFFIDIRNLSKLNNFLKQISSHNRYSDYSSIYNRLDYFDIKPTYQGKIAYIPIMTGCNNFCSYCAVPLTRGREKSRPMEDIIKEVKDVVDSGFKEIWLLGQNVNSYGIIKNAKLKSQSDKSKCEIDNTNFIKLLKSVDNLSGDFKFNFISSNPQDMGDDLIDTFANLKKWTKELHLAMQSGDDEILRKMNRKCTSQQFLDLVSRLKLEIRNLKLSTDIIVGFPSETKVQFKNTVKICKKIGFWKAYVNQYSPREGTVSAKMTDDVPAGEKKRRWEVLNKLINKK